MCKQRHVHADMMIAYANDPSQVVQYKSSNGSWYDVECPGWDPVMTYRFKPKSKVKKWKYAYGYTLDSGVGNARVSVTRYASDEEAEEGIFDRPLRNMWVFRLDHTMQECEE